MAKTKSSGAKAKSSSTTTPPAYLRETEKAVKLTVGVDYYDREKIKEYSVWVPKSQLAADGRPGEWISHEKAREAAIHGEMWEGKSFAYWKDANGNFFQPSKTAKEIEREQKRQNAFNAGKQSYQELVQRAKDMGIKGVRVGMRRKTIEEKIKKAGG